MSWIVAFALTLAIEVPIMLGLLRFWLNLPPRAAFPLIVAGNLLTHPIVWFVTPAIPADLMAPDLVLTIAEVFAMIAEALVLRLRSPSSYSRLLIVTFAANSASLLIGTFLV